MTIHREIHLEDEICADLAAAGWLFDPTDASRYDRTQALYLDDVIAWIKASQPKAWDAIDKSHGTAAPKVIAERLRKALDTQGTLAVLRNGFDLIGLKQALAMCQFKPALAMNADLQSRYAANRLRVVRQVRYSVHHENCFDLVLFVNGIPVATAELKSHYTQGIQDAIYQYQTDREPLFKPKNAPEPLLAFPGGALVHFAVSNAEAAMTTRLAGLDTVFLPFNQGNAGGAGNPPKEGIATDYLWKEVWQRDSFLQILGRYLVPVKNDKKQLIGWIFPRYHQLKVTRRLVAAVSAEGPGHKYLVQHSAGSGKTNSIAWSAHFLADLHDAQDHKVFDTVIVISDRTVLDTQLREAIESFERTRGVVAVVTGEGASKSKELAEALSAGKKIVVCTIQTFPFALEEVRKLAATRHKRFAVIADEAHSSQTNETAAKLKLVLSAAELAEVQDGGEISTEDILAAQMSAKANADEKAGITYVAFTATPKEKTLQLFGTRPDPTRPPAADNLPAAFDVYSMRQAIEEGFILDVLKTYTSYKVAFSLAHHGKAIDSREVDRSEAMKGIMGWVRLHEYNIAQRVQVVVEHYRKHVAGLLAGKAKAMVVTGSLAACRSFLARAPEGLLASGFDRASNRSCVSQSHSGSWQAKRPSGPSGCAAGRRLRRCDAWQWKSHCLRAAPCIHPPNRTTHLTRKDRKAAGGHPLAEGHSQVHRLQWRIYGFLSQIFDYGNTDIEKRSIFFRLARSSHTGRGRWRRGLRRGQGARRRNGSSIPTTSNAAIGAKTEPGPRSEKMQSTCRFRRRKS